MRLDLDGAGKGVVVAHREMGVLPDGTFAIEDYFEIAGTCSRTFATCRTWLLELVELHGGDMAFERGDETIRPEGGRFGLFYPPFSILSIHTTNVRCRWKGLAASDPLPKEFLSAPILFETACVDAPRSVGDVREILASSRRRQSIERNPAPSLLSIRAKRIVDENYAMVPAISRIAARLGVSHPHLTRQFKRDFGLSPNAYCQQLRIVESKFLLARGDEIVDVAEGVGFNDLSRFYKQFGKATTKTPGYCQAPKTRGDPSRPERSKNAKTRVGERA